VTFFENCIECDWSESWEGGSAADDPGIEHAKETGHTVRTHVLDEAQKVSERSATSEEIAEWDEEHDGPHPVFSVPHRPERKKLEFEEDPDVGE